MFGIDDLNLYLKKKIETGHPDLNQKFSLKGIFLSKFLKYNNIKYHHCHYLNFKALLEIDIFIICTNHYFFLLFSLFFILFSLLLLIRKYSDKKKYYLSEYQSVRKLINY